MNVVDFEVSSVRPAPAGANYLGTITFAFRPSEFEPVRITHSSEVDGKWVTYTDAEIDGARIVRVRSAFLCRSKAGELYVRASGLNVPRAVSHKVAEVAMAELDKGDAR